jgi:tetratricopeptide (TPR) repeat protein
MALDAYSPCPCGSGKKFKWCCQPIHVQIDKAFRQEAEGQHDSALRIMDEVIAEHPANPEAWGRKAQLLYQNERVEEAENALQKALEINPNYPFGHLLRAIFRQQEGEHNGALLLLRRAAELYDPEARDFLGQIYSHIAESELSLNRPVAARAALKIAIHYRPGQEDLREGFDGLFGDKSTLPTSARREYSFRSPSAGVSAEARRRWEEALSRAATGKLSDAARAFNDLTRDDPKNAAAWFNLGLSRAWLGENEGALEALDQFVALETNETEAAAAWALGEVLRCGRGMEEHTDYLERSALYQLREPQRIVDILEQWDREGRLLGARASKEQGMLAALVLERTPDLTPALRASQLAEVGAHLLLFGDNLRLWHTNADALNRICQELEQRLGEALSPPRTDQSAAHFVDIFADAIAFPVHITDQVEAKRRVSEHFERYFEETWIHRPLRSLNLIPPVDAVGHPSLRKKVLGVIQFLQECAAPNEAMAYDFDRLRRKLGLLASEPGAVAAAIADSPDVGKMSAAELAALSPQDLSEEVLERAYQAALQLDAREVAARFARTLVTRPRRAGRPDRYPWYSHLIQLAMGEGDTESALKYLDDAEKADSEENEGRRHNDYQLRRGQLHAKRGEVDQAQRVFDELVGRAPSDLRFTGSAAEAMLGLKQPASAQRFAEQGLVKAREKNDRASEDYFKELVAAARKQASAK